MAKHVLTQKQQTAFEFIQRYVAEHRRSPLIREIQSGCQITSYKSVLDRLNALERKGMIRRAPYRHHGIKITRRALPPLVGTAEPSLEGAREGVVV